jgi:hypothetical protein
MDFLQLLNAIARVAKPDYQEFVPLQDMATPIAQSNLDSLDLLITSIYMCELYGIDQETSKGMSPATPQDLLNFLNKHKTKEPQSIEAALKEVQ